MKETPYGPVFDNVLEGIGKTPMIKVSKIDAGKCDLFLKLEANNPGGSIKDRIGVAMIEAAEQSGALKPGGTIIEATAGNTGLALALVAAQKGYKTIIIVPDKMAQEKIFHLKALGADVRLTRSDVGKGHPEYYQDMAERIAEETGAFYVNQFGNAANPVAHIEGTGPEILGQMDGKVDALIAGIGSAGTMTGLSRFFAENSPSTEMILADPVGSILTDYVNTGKIPNEVGSWLVEGIGEDFIPDIADLSKVKKAYAISDQESFEAARDLLKKEGILAGSSSGTILCAALKYCREQKEKKRVVAFVCDRGDKYLSKMFNDYWMYDQGFLKREPKDDLTDLITRRHSERATVTVKPDDTLMQAYGKMKLYDISQLPVLGDEGEVQGLLDEEDLLFAVVRNHDKWGDPVKSAMTYRVETLEATRPIEDLLPVFTKGYVAVVVKGGEFEGLITRTDLLNYLRLQVAQ
ncbi:MAG: pyridoxal-phosphate dependent enzyme [Marinicaulis sp.]|nr:pyridoxal-phosphate dependent enzyme [Marinicaulis sp.]NNE40368.1 pyridoxal-phosphate dependent enzyme [Marinicaulis sp.]NNL88075.1 pyridoxal-phosphate dependent enzyme [Marinicaulis sp.]